MTRTSVALTTRPDGAAAGAPVEPSAWSRVLAEASARGGTPAQVAARLGLPEPLVCSVLDHAERLGLVTVAGRTCTSSCPTGPTRPATCHGCPLAP
ncbi:helix-turn-helix domain-containing protein [Cellulomonas sp. P24]|uniref:MarR family transcriptional regulator n=1 Tax=Cellulomonas sp. P24 TaxID=2885206 RepID=UPI00216B2DE2|nr:helix-turn-helix domain-containing protein [Cellulomonas sp. P24]MCR6492876.1 MarR family transcriptional regulator [Cellulomonas sp. P24]